MSPKQTSRLRAKARQLSASTRPSRNQALTKRLHDQAADTPWRQRLVIRRRNAAEHALIEADCVVASAGDTDMLHAQLERRRHKRDELPLPCHNHGCAQLFDCPGKCEGSCPQAWRALRLDLLQQCLDLLAKHKRLHFVTLASPHWKRTIGELHSMRHNTMKQWLTSRLEAAASDVIAIGGIEASLNVELDGTMRWAPHVHMIVANTTAHTIKQAFSTDRFAAMKSENEKPLRVVPVTHIGKQLGYCVKGHVVERVAYIGSHGRQTRKTNRLRTAFLAEHDSWLADAKIAERLILIGVRWYPIDQRLQVL